VSVVGGTSRCGGASSAERRLQLASVASPGGAVFSRLELATDLQVDNLPRLGRLELSQGALREASGVGITGSGDLANSPDPKCRLMFRPIGHFANT